MTAAILGFEDYHHQTSISITASSHPGVSMSTSGFQPVSRVDEMIDFSLASAVTMPPFLCRWSIHGEVPTQWDIHGKVSTWSYRPTRSQQKLNLNDEESWSTWPCSCKTWPCSCEFKEFTAKLSDSLETNAFSNVRLRDFPVAVDLIVRAVRDSPNELLVEARGVSIMSRNVSLVESLLSRIGEYLDVAGLFPFHLAVSFLDGSKTCCSILDALEETHPLSLHKLYVNDHGHTVLDQLMIAILKSHTFCLTSSSRKRSVSKEKRWISAGDGTLTLTAFARS